MFGQLRRNQPRPEIVGAARRITDDNSDRLALEVRSLRRSFNGAKENEKKPNADPPEVAKTTSPGKRGRPQGRTKRHRRAVEWSPARRFVQETITRFLQLIGDHVKVIYFVYDGAFGNNDALQMVKQTGLHLIAKLRHDSALYFPSDGPYSGRGKRRKYGKKLDYQHLPAEYVQSSSLEDGMQTKIYQMKVWHKTCADLLNVVVIVKTNVKTQAMAHVVLFSSDLELRHDQLIDYYHLRFQIEVV